MFRDLRPFGPRNPLGVSAVECRATVRRPEHGLQTGSPGNTSTTSDKSPVVSLLRKMPLGCLHHSQECQNLSRGANRKVRSEVDVAYESALTSWGVGGIFFLVNLEHNANANFRRLCEKSGYDQSQWDPAATPSRAARAPGSFFA